MKTSKSILSLSLMMVAMLLTGCFGGKMASSASRGGEVVGVGGRSFVEIGRAHV